MAAQNLLAFAVVALAIYFIAENLGLFPAKSHGRRRWSHGAERQLDAVRGASFEKKKLLNFSEYNVFRIIEAEIARERRGYRVFAQTSLGEILACADAGAFWSINSKRVDILVVDQNGWPVLAVEYQGEGHYQGTSTLRDAIKKEALAKAGINYLEIFPGDKSPQIRDRVREQLGWVVTSARNAEHSAQFPAVPAPSPETTAFGTHDPCFAARPVAHPSISSST